jgi:hypothetical protein
MKHYENLIERLRNGTKLPLLQALMNEAADAIEELQTRSSVLGMMQEAGGLWGFGQDGRLYQLGTADIFAGCKTVRVFPEKEAES